MGLADDLRKVAEDGDRRATTKPITLRTKGKDPLVVPAGAEVHTDDKGITHHSTSEIRNPPEVDSINARKAMMKRNMPAGWKQFFKD